ncbi:hypothetical protein ANN_26692 [Periplaneta americana]|uniref:THAP-type domain-containing protein n=1 Tax=Periplaneta americana TaxID=6978 RepID=A0ABQ8RYX4_PERAM|nr:hypothetical protein ANN_26692 [Periplaneta americana]
MVKEFGAPGKDVVHKIWLEFGLNEQRMKESVEALKKWLAMEPHLPEESGTCFFPMPELTPEGDRVIMMKYLSKDAMNYLHEDLARLCLMTTEVRMCEEYCFSDIFILDLENYTVGHASKMTFTTAKKGEVCLMKWCVAISREGDKPRTLWTSNKKSRVCRRHFKEDDFSISTTLKCLLPNVVPSVFDDFPRHKQNVSNISRRNKRRITEVVNNIHPAKKINPIKETKKSPMLLFYKKQEGIDVSTQTLPLDFILVPGEYRNYVDAGTQTDESDDSCGLVTRAYVSKKADDTTTQTNSERERVSRRRTSDTGEKS